MQILVCILIVLIILFIKYQKPMEGFRQFYQNSCYECTRRSYNSCGECANCGYCITPSGEGECLPGNVRGPYFRSDCVYWINSTNPFYYYFGRFFSRFLPRYTKKERRRVNIYRNNYYPII